MDKKFPHAFWYAPRDWQSRLDVLFIIFPVLYFFFTAVLLFALIQGRKTRRSNVHIEGHQEMIYSMATRRHSDAIRRCNKTGYVLPSSTTAGLGIQQFSFFFSSSSIPLSLLTRARKHFFLFSSIVFTIKSVMRIFSSHLLLFFSSSVSLFGSHFH